MVQRSSIVHIFLLGCFVLVFFLSAAKVQAQSKSGFTLEPVYQEVVIEAEDPEKAVVTTQITLSNNTPQAATFEVFSVAFPNAHYFGSFQNTDLSNLTERQELLAVRFDADRFVVDPNDAHTVTVRIENRADLRPGGTYASILVRQVMTAEVAQGTQPVVPALASQLLIRKKGGEVRNLSLTGIVGLPSWFTEQIPVSVGLTFSNSGNVHLIPRGSVTVQDFFGRVVAQGIVNDGSLFVLPGLERTIPITIAPSQFVIPLVPLVFTVEGSAESVYYTYEQSFTVVPWWVLIFFTAIVLFFVLRFIYIHREKKKIAKELPHVPEL